MVTQHKLGLARRFDFTSKLMRASVIVKNFSNGTFKSFVKGSPEKIKELSLPSTVPQNFDEIQQLYTNEGYRVIALAYKNMDITYSQVQEISREECEDNLHFLGFLIMQNRLKPVTNEVIQTLNKANVRTIMATGDNILTAVSVARQCSIVQSDADIFICDIKKEGNVERLNW